MLQPTSEEDDNTWALELEEELDLAGPNNRLDSEDQSKPESVETKAENHTRPSVASLPVEVLALIISFGQVGRVCKSWSLASVALARRRFSSRLADILCPLNSNAVEVALDVEAELYAAYGQR
ncbi:hypothetical protein PsorP6_003329 [Peronosclerospora sorghi]|uniref:Uncharacterized protein n=1 Tax=Peronosclerospora sorghi TaxID=230839 RepID=A0ACC0VJ81_9STRA|nr:hypothetical protein PsorP6_003329 [Peronosclerospora sorghi]